MDREGKLIHIDKLVLFFGMTEGEIWNAFYKEKKELALFDIAPESRKIEEPIARIAELYIQRLKTLFKEVTEEPLALYNSKNIPIYHFAFASNNKTAKKIAADIIGRKSN